MYLRWKYLLNMDMIPQHAPTSCFPRIRRFYTINLEFPELAEERDAVMEACIEHYNYEYIPNGTEGKSDGFR